MIRLLAVLSLSLLIGSCARAVPASELGSSGATRPYRVSELTVEPKLANSPEIACALESLRPLALRYARGGGTTVLDFTVSETGRVETVRVYQGSGSPEIDGAALRVAERMRFSPGRVGRTPVSTRFTWPLQITLSETPPVPPGPRGRAAESGCSASSL